MGLLLHIYYVLVKIEVYALLVKVGSLESIFGATLQILMANKWLSMTNSRKRNQPITTYNDDWSTYEVRGSSSGGQSSSIVHCRGHEQ